VLNNQAATESQEFLGLSVVLLNIGESYQMSPYCMAPVSCCSDLQHGSTKLLSCAQDYSMCCWLGGSNPIVYCLVVVGQSASHSELYSKARDLSKKA